MAGKFLRRSAAILLVAGMAGSGIGVLAPSANAAASRPVRPAVKVCGSGAARTRPSSMVLTCADDGELAEHLHWLSWTRTRATATGIVTWRACTANCLDSKTWKSTSAHVTLTDPLPEPGRRVLFTQLKLHVTGPTPPRFMRNLTFDEAPTLSPSPRAQRPGASPPALPSAAPSGTLGYAQVEGFWEDAGGPTTAAGSYTDAQIAAAITGAESSYQPGVIQPGVDYCGAGADRAGWGLWQITCGNSVPQFGTDFQLLDPWNNAEAAVAKYNGEVAQGDNGFDAWSTYTASNTPYLNFIQHTAADTQLTDPGEYVHVNAIPAGTPSSPAADPGSTFGPPLTSGSPGGDLWLRDSSGSQSNTTAGMAAGTSPAVAELTTGGYEVAFQANNGDLWLRNSLGSQTDTTTAMMPGTSPAITGLPGGGYEVAFQADTKTLWLRNSSGSQTDTTAGMEAGTSPAIAELEGGGYEVAFQADTKTLWLRDSSGSQTNTTAGMEAGTSPAITGLPGGGYEVAFQANTKSLWLRTSSGSQTDTTAGMEAGTSPAITSLEGGGYEVAFQANTKSLWLRTSSGSQTNTTAGMEAGTSPAVAGLAAGGFEVAFQANTKSLWLRTSSGSQSNTTAGMGPDTSPAIAALSAGGYEVAFQDNT